MATDHSGLFAEGENSESVGMSSGTPKSNLYDTMPDEFKNVERNESLKGNSALVSIHFLVKSIICEGNDVKTTYL